MRDEIYFCVLITGETDLLKRNPHISWKHSDAIYQHFGNWSAFFPYIIIILACFFGLILKLGHFFRLGIFKQKPYGSGPKSQVSRCGGVADLALEPLPFDAARETTEFGAANVADLELVTWPSMYWWDKNWGGGDEANLWWRAQGPGCFWRSLFLCWFFLIGAWSGSQGWSFNKVGAFTWFLGGTKLCNPKGSFEIRRWFIEWWIFPMKK